MRVLRASPVARMVALAAAAVMVNAVATLAPVVAAIRSARLARGVAHAGASCAPRSTPEPSSCDSGRSPSVAGLVGRQRGGDLVEACAERDGDGLGHPAAAEPAVGQVDV
jgi:hypothetical protein